ncbi:transposable element Tc1 transposase [Trichonephila clavipes]|nr:transposable element Tc1 transposase [Trichonephila clavipes]
MARCFKKVRHLCSRQLEALWSTATCVLMSASSIHRRMLHRGLRVRVPLYRILLTANHRRLRLQWAHEHRAWQADWHQVVFSDESRCNLWDQDGCIRVRYYAFERYLPECVIERHSDLTPRVTVRVAISYHGRSNLLRIEGNSNRYIREVLYSPKSFPSFKASLELTFSRIMHSHMLQRLLFSPALNIVFFLKFSSFICSNTSRLCIKFHLLVMIPSWCCIFYQPQFI